MKETTRKTHIKGDLSMKKSLFVLVLALALVFAFSAAAGAKYAGYAPDGMDAGNDVMAGYLSWPGAQAMAGANQLGNTAHGGYITNSTKCAVCHSVHRAYWGVNPTNAAAPGSGSVGSAVNVKTNNYLAFAGACIECHTTFGSGSATKLIEWAPSGAGPHSSQNCTGMCHAGGIHGTRPSRFNGMNAYMLGNAGGSDALIMEEMGASNFSGNISYDDTWAAGTLTGAGWFQKGNTGTPNAWSTPPSVNAPQFAAAKGAATGYTCNRAGCHNNSIFAVLDWGFGGFRTATAADPEGTELQMTGHSVGNFSNHVGNNCGPCHPGCPSGGFGDAASTGYPTAQNQSRAFGCDQCHDMVGVLTGTTAWPHANRAINVFEWAGVGEPDVVAQASGNLWMYLGNIGSYAQTPTGTTYTAMDQSWVVRNQAVTGTTALTDPTAGSGIINDGVCLKCHIPTDALTLQYFGAPANSNVAATRRTGHNLNGRFPWNAAEWGRPVIGTRTTYAFSGSDFIFIVK